MSYSINKTNGVLLAELLEGTIDQTITDLTLLGKNSESYGEFFNENLVHLLENFANTSAPNNPIIGQLWFDTSDDRLKVYDGTEFKVSGGTIVSSTVPGSITKGDLWVDEVNKQLFFNDGISNILAGPQYTNAQGLSGFQVADILDENGQRHTIVSLYVAQTLMGIFSKHRFTPAEPIDGFTGIIDIGFNVSTLSGIKFHVPVTQSLSLIDSFGNQQTTDSFLTTTAEINTLTSTFILQNKTPLVLGPGSNNEMQVSSLEFALNSNSANQNFTINVLNNGELVPGIKIVTLTKRVGIFTETPTATLDVNGDAVIQGSLTVKGNTTIINTTNLAIKDKLIELGIATQPTNDTADGGGIAVKGDTDKTIIWDKLLSSWVSSESINLVVGNSYKINGTPVLTSSSLGTTITSSSLTSVGTLTSLTVDNVNIDNATISAVSILANENLTISPKGSGYIDVSDSKLKNLADPDSDPAIDLDAAINKQTLLRTVRQRPLALSLDITNLQADPVTFKNPQIIIQYLNKIFPVSEISVVGVNGPVCRIVCTDNGVVSLRRFVVVSNTWQFDDYIV